MSAPPASVVGGSATTAAPAVTPTIRATLRRRRIWIVFAALVVLGVLAIALIGGTARGGGPRLGAENPAPEGAKALVAVLAGHGVETTVAATYERALEEAKTGATVLVYDELGVLSTDRYSKLGLYADRLVVVAPDFTALESLAPGVRLAGVAGGPIDDVACDVPTAVRAGSLSDDQRLFNVDEDAAADGWLGCFRDGDHGYAVVTGESRGGEVALVGATTSFENGRITERGNAALAVGLTGASDRLVWYLPGPTDAETEAAPTIAELTPGWVSPVLALAVVVTIVTGIWQGRRFGPLVAENLPVHVPAGETSEGRARLYARNAARAHALDQLRIGTIGRLAETLRLPRGLDVEQLAEAAAATTGRDPVAVRRLLVDDVPGGDAELVRLAGELTELEDDVRATLSPETRPGRRP
ncbi:hypothetical protein MUN74_02390 [Agromyces endophyticus]|uniref:DUF4350 domain-containing protein n=1 Tax=Agromyces sp. H17E-10 TaxID=2932244 RepID=UPI001FD44CFE|nr:DUF4350 domain-containing protein [Agromyces sp. H17E-10]UOQ89790.1 hypothetical protein MUN74_02390 [Agromyces sp. H17E-10]